MSLQTKIPDGPLEKKWQNYKKNAKLVNPNNRKKLEVIVVGTGLAGASAAASLAEMGAGPNHDQHPDEAEDQRGKPGALGLPNGDKSFIQISSIALLCA